MKRILLTLALLLGLVLPADAAITRGVGPATASQLGPGTDCVLTLNSTTTGRMLVIVANWYEGGGAATISSITISGGESNATVVAGSKYTSAGMTSAGQIAYLTQIASGGNKTITVTMSLATYISCGVMEYAGQDTSSQPDASANYSNFDADGSDSCNTTITTATANALIVALCTNGGQPSTAGSGYTLWGTYPNINFDEEVEDQLDAGAAGSKAVTFTDPFNDSGMAIVSFKAAGGGGGGVPVRHRVTQQ